MGILEVAQTAQTQLDELCAETGLPACELHVAVFTGKPDGWGIVFRPTWFGNLFMFPTLELSVTEDGMVMEPGDGSELLRRDGFYNACSNRAAELAPPKTDPYAFNSEYAIRDAGGWMVRGDERVRDVGMHAMAIVSRSGSAQAWIRDKREGACRTVIDSPRSVPPEHKVLAVLPNGVYWATQSDGPWIVSTSIGDREYPGFEDSVRAAVALATKTQP